MTQQTQPQSNALAIIDTRRVPLAVQTFGEDRVAMIKEQIGRGWKEPMTDVELEHIALVCQKTRLDPLVKPPLIYFIQRFDKQAGRLVMTPQVSIDGLRIIASRSRDYAGQLGPQWCGPDGEWKDIWTANTPPAAARVGVLRRGSREPLWSVAMYREWVQDTPFWKSKPAHMLAKTAEGISLKRACPAETNELELAHLEEMDRLEAPVRAARYAELYGADEDHAFAELPAGAGAPSYASHRERDDLVDLPREQEPTAAVASPAAAPPASTTESRRGDLLDMYGQLLSQARTLGVVDDNSVKNWTLAKNMPEAEIIAKGRDLRALVNQATVARATAPAAPAQPEPEMVGVRSPLYERVSDLFLSLVRLEISPSDFAIEWPAPKEEVLRKIERMEAMIEQAERQQQEQQQAAPEAGESLEALPF